MVHRRDDNADQYIGYLFTYCGVLAALLQGGMIGRLVKVFGEARLIFGSLIVFATGLVLLPLLPQMGWLIVGLGLVAAGSGLNRPPTFGLISMNTSPDEQGATLGVAQSAGSLARIFGPVLANVLFKFSVALPYLLCAGIATFAGFLAWQHLCRGAPVLASGQTQSTTP